MVSKDSDIKERHDSAKELGLDRAAGFLHALSQGLISNGPLASTAVAMTSAMAFALGATPLAYLIGSLLVLTWINTPYQFSKYLASAGGMYYYVTKAGFPSAGYFAGIAYMIYYFIMPSANFIMFALILEYILGVNKMSYFISFALIAMVILMIIMVLHITKILDYGFATASIEMVLLIFISLYIIHALGPHNTLAVYNYQLASGGLSGFAVGMLIAGFGMSGSTAIVYLGSEAKTPTKIIKEALLVATFIIFGLYYLVSYAFTVGWGYTNISTLLEQPVPGLAVISKYLGFIGAVIFGIFILNSLIGVNVAGMIVVTRLQVAFARLGLFPGIFGKTSRRYKSPYIAAIINILLSGIIAILLSIWIGPLTAMVFTILVATIGEFLGHFIGNIALPFYYRKIKLNWFLHVILPIVNSIIIIFGIYYTFYPPTMPYVLAPVILLVAFLLGYIQLLYVKRKKDPGLRRFMEEFGRIGEDFYSKA